MLTWSCMLLQAGAGGASSADGPALLVWGIVLLAVAAVLLVMEMIVPSGGLISLAAAGAAVGGLVCLVFEDSQLGFLTTFAVLIASPFIAGFMFKVWPNTPIGRMLIHRNASEDGGDDGDNDQRNGRPQGPTGEPIPAAHVPAVGATGTARTPLRPVGTCVFGGASGGVRVECLADVGMIDAGAAVRVVEIDGTEVRVREFSPPAP